MGSVLDKSDPSWPVLAGGQVGGLDLSGLIWEA